MSAVSVVVAAYNYGRFIAEALESIQGQTFGDFDVVIADDGSTDNTRDVVQPFLADRRFRLLTLPHRGQPQTKNAGIQSTKAPIVAFLDADDRWRPSKLERQLERIRERRAGVVYCGRALIDESGRSLGEPRQPIHRGQVLNPLFIDNFICFSSSMVRREVFEAVGMFDEALPLAIDFDLWLRASRLFEFDGIAEPLVEYRTGHANLSRRTAERLRIALGIMERFVANDRTKLLTDATIRQAFGDTWRSLGLVSRNEPGRGIEALKESLRWNPIDSRTWKALAGSLTPRSMRQLARWTFGVRDWETV